MRVKKLVALVTIIGVLISTFPVGCVKAEEQVEDTNVTICNSVADEAQGTANIVCELTTVNSTAVSKSYHFSLKEDSFTNIKAQILETKSNLLDPKCEVALYSDKAMSSQVFKMSYHDFLGSSKTSNMYLYLAAGDYYIKVTNNGESIRKSDYYAKVGVTISVVAANKVLSVKAVKSEDGKSSVFTYENVLGDRLSSVRVLPGNYQNAEGYKWDPSFSKDVVEFEKDNLDCYKAVCSGAGSFTVRITTSYKKGTEKSYLVYLSTADKTKYGTTSKPVITSAKKGAKCVKGKKLAKSTIYVKIGKKVYTKYSAGRSFSISTKKLKKGQKILVWQVTLAGKQSKKISYKVK